MAQPASRITSDQRVVRTLTSHAASAVEESCKIQRAVEANVCWLNEFVAVRFMSIFEFLKLWLMCVSFIVSKKKVRGVAGGRRGSRR